jgi:hypothetical protein
MKTRCMTLLAAAMACGISNGVEAQVGPQLFIQWLPDRKVELIWTNSSAPFLLEASSAVSPSGSWQPISLPTLGADTLSVVTLEAVEASRFFRLRTPDLTGIIQTSPVNGETGVAVTRETIFRLNYALASNTVLRTSNVFAEFGGRRYLSRVELSSDRQTVSLFYLEPLPGSARVRVTFDAPGLLDEFGRLVDLNGDGVPGGAAYVEFDTLSLTPLAGTAVIGRVFASELQPGPDTGTNAVNTPLGGVTITVDGMEQTLRTVTDPTGNFKLEPVPPGRFFVHIDGRTVTNEAAGIRYPDRAYYPFVGKAWEAVAGRQDNLAGGDRRDLFAADHGGHAATGQPDGGDDDHISTERRGEQSGAGGRVDHRAGQFALRRRWHARRYGGHRPGAAKPIAGAPAAGAGIPPRDHRADRWGLELRQAGSDLFPEPA